MHTLKTIPVTIVSIGIYAVIVLLHYIIFQETVFSDESLILFGALDRQLVSEGQIWRLLTQGFSHMSTNHFFVNLPAIFIFSRFLERFYGSFKFFVFLVFTTISSGVFIFLFYEGSMPVSGSSGQGFGFLGICTFLTIRYFKRISTYNKLMMALILFIAFLTTFIIPGVVISGHLGGFFGGMIVAFIDSLIRQEKAQTTE